MVYMPHLAAKSKGTARRASKPKVSSKRRLESRFSVGLSAPVTQRVEKYAAMVDSSMSKALASLVQLGLDSQESRKREFFKKLKANLATGDPAREDELVDQFRSLILGH